MGVYIFRSHHGPYIKVGHYAGQNAYSRIAHRGFYSCVCPIDIENRVSVEDVELVAWFPSLSKKDEASVKKQWKDCRISGSEWFAESLFAEIYAFLSEKDMDQKECCDLQLALSTRRRL